MSKQIFLPESMYEVDSTMTYEKIISFYKKESSIIGKVTRLNSKDNIFEVSLGNDLIGIMPVEDSTIYPIYKNSYKYSYNVIALVGKTIQAKISSLDDNKIFLSRKENMLDALNILKEQSEIKFASITSFSQSSAYIDIGAGIMGKSSNLNLAHTVYKDAMDLGYKKGSVLPVKIVGFQDEINCFDLSVVDTFPNFKDELNENDVVSCKVFGSLGDGIGYYVLINNKYCGIVDSQFHKLNYGDEISATIHKISDKGPRLRLVEKL